MEHATPGCGPIAADQGPIGRVHRTCRRGGFEQTRCARSSTPRAIFKTQVVWTRRMTLLGVFSIVPLIAGHCCFSGLSARRTQPSHAFAQAWCCWPFYVPWLGGGYAMAWHASTWAKTCLRRSGDCPCQSGWLDRRSGLVAAGAAHALIRATTRRWSNVLGIVGPRTLRVRA